MNSNKEHYVNNKDFSNAVHEYVVEADRCKNEGKEVPCPSDYIGDCFLKICTRQASKYNFNRYTYKDEMILDGIHDCVKGILNFDIEKVTRRGCPNAYGYFSRVSYNAFIRRIEKEKKQQRMKEALISQSTLDDFVDDSGYDGSSMIERIKSRIETAKMD